MAANNQPNTRKHEGWGSTSLTGREYARRGSCFGTKYAGINDLSRAAVAAREGGGVRWSASGPTTGSTLRRAAYVQGRGLHALDSAGALGSCAISS